MHRTSRAALSLIASLAILIGIVGTAPDRAGADQIGDEQLFVQLINQLRSDRGVPALVVDPELTSAARTWTATMAADDRLTHSPNMAAGISAPWTVLGENVGVHGALDVPALFQAFVSSPSHYQNLVDPRFGYLGVGVVHDRNGKLWTTHRFMAAEKAVVPPATTPQTVPTTVPTPPTTPDRPTTGPKSPPPKPTAPPTTSAPKPSNPPTTAADQPAPETGQGSGQGSTTSVAPLPETEAIDVGPITTTTMVGLDEQELAELVKPDQSTIEDVLIDLVEAGI